MANTFKTLLNDDHVNTRTLLHEAIPITGTILSGTYGTNNVKTFSHGQFESVYDYPYLSSSANHLVDVTFGYSSAMSQSANLPVSGAIDHTNSAGAVDGGDLGAIGGYAADTGRGESMTQNAKKLNIYNQMAQVLMGYKHDGTIRKFDSDGTVSDLDDDSGIMNHCFFLNYSRLLTKDEIKKGTYRLKYRLQHTRSISTETSFIDVATGSLVTLGDYNATSEYRTSPAGDYGLIFTASADSSDNSNSVGLVFYQAGVVVLTASMFATGTIRTHDNPAVTPDHFAFGPSAGDYGSNTMGTTTIQQAMGSGSIEQLAAAFRNRVVDNSFNNTIELNSSIYFCRINHNEYNYSANPTYTTGSKLVVKNNAKDLPVTYITTVGLYSPDNELMAVAKLSEPIRKDPNTELTLRVRLDY